MTATLIPFLLAAAALGGFTLLLRSVFWWQGYNAAVEDQADRQVVNRW